MDLTRSGGHFPRLIAYFNMALLTVETSSNFPEKFERLRLNGFVLNGFASNGIAMTGSIHVTKLWQVEFDLVQGAKGPAAENVARAAG